jgi:hypothetical protein
MEGESEREVFIAMPRLRWDQNRNPFIERCRMPLPAKGVYGMESGTREWRDERAHRLYSLASSSSDRKIRDEAVHFLGALERAGSDDAAWAISSLKKLEKKDRKSPA